MEELLATLPLQAPSDRRGLRTMLAEQDGLLERFAERRDPTSPEWFYGFVLEFLASIDFSEAEARDHYFRILEHKYLLSERLERDIGLRVAALDYLLNMTGLLKNPKIVEITLFEEILNMSKEDPKTGCFNERFFREMVNVELRRAERHEQTLSLMLVDIDDFKGLNDRCGHLFGDRVLKKFAELLKSSARIEDVVGRYGGDEFVLLLPQTGRVGARSLGERIRLRLIEHFGGKSFEGRPAGVTFSAGIATYPYDAQDYEGLVRCADAALFKSKRLGKNRIYDYLDEQLAREDESGDTADKRRFRRFRIEEENMIHVQGPDGVVAITGRLVNISAGGALLECHCTIDEGLYNKKLAVSVERIGKGFLDGLNLPGSVVRVNCEDRRFRFHMALQFERELSLDEWAGIERHAALVPA